MSIPQGYKQTELGLIPADWDIQSVGKHCTVKARIGWQGLRSDEYLPSGEYGLITSTDIVDGAIDWKTCCFVSKTRYTQDPNIIVQEDDTLISKDGTIGKVGIVQNIPFPSTLNSGVFVVRPKLDNVYKQYLAFAFKSIYFQDFINRLTAGSTIVHLYQKDIVKFSFPVPPIAEQRAIAEALSDVDGLIAALDKKIAKKRLLKQGAMQQLLTGKTRLPGFTDEWVEKKLGDIGTLSMCKRIFQEETSDSGDVPFYKIGTFGQDADAFISKDKYEHYKNMYRFPKKGDILISAAGTIGRIVVYDGKPAYFQDSNIIWLAHNQKDILNRYLSYIYQIIEWNTENTTIERLYNDNFNNTIVFFPKSQIEQQAIATVLSDMDKEIADLEAQRDKYRLLKSGMMQKLLTGQIRLKTE